MELKNKKVVFLGDSITEGRDATSESNIYHQIIKRECELSLAWNCGISGTRIAKRKVPTYNTTKFDLYFGLRENVMPKDVDIVVVFGGTNDYGHGNGGELGEIDAVDDYSFNGALNNLITNLKNHYPNSPIIFLTPLHRVNDDISVNGTGNVLEDYVNAIIEATKRHNVYLIDLFNELNLDPHDKSLFPDGLHPNNDGHLLLAKFLIKKLLEL